MNYVFVVVGFLIMAGTAGASDIDVTMSMTQITVQVLIGIAIFALGWYGLISQDAQENY
jgi:Na+/H+-dicarboxylate symporter